MLIATGLRLLRSRRDKSDAPRCGGGCRPVFALVGILRIGGVLSVVLYCTMAAAGHAGMAAEFRHDGAKPLAAVQHSLPLQTGLLEGVAAFSRTAPDNRQFVRPLLASNPTIQAPDRAPRVLSGEPPPTERAARRDGYPGFAVTEHGDQGMHPAAPRSDYLPIGLLGTLCFALLAALYVHSVRHQRQRASKAEALLRDAIERISDIGTLGDVTELRLAVERQRELEQQLIHSQKFEALATLAGGIAHDLNNALMPVIALSQMALEDLVHGSALHEDLTVIAQAAERARDLVKQILAFSRRQELVRREIDLAVVTRDAVRMLRGGLTTTVHLVEDIAAVPPVFGNPVQLNQVVLNLVTNAAQAIGADTGSVTVRLKPEGKGVRLEVADTGCGMDDQTAARIFEPFFTTRDGGEGTGLGLSVVHRIVTGHGGAIAVRSAPGAGTVFTIVLPAAKPAAAAASAIAA